jgi:hypothetical protein
MSKTKLYRMRSSNPNLKTRQTVATKTRRQALQSAMPRTNAAPNMIF